MSEEKSKSTGKVSTENYKGVRDFYPEDQAIERYILSTMAEVAELFGYQEYNASPLEPSELYASKTSEEIVNEQTYTFDDRGGRSVTLRPEMTPTVARMVAAKRKSLPFPQRLYSIPNVFRYERPQRGRLREHYQLNVDLFGVSGLDAEVEVITLADTLLKEFGLESGQYEIRINDRAILEKRFSDLGIDGEKKKALYRLLDKKDKITNFSEELVKIVGEEINLDVEESEKIKQLREELEARGIDNTVFKSDMVRGFDYYTGVIFEIFDTHPENNRSLFGGGRYDNLLEMFGEESVPTVGFGMGDVTMRDVLETYDLLPRDVSFTDVYVCVLGGESKQYADEVAFGLRTNGVRTAVDLRYDTLSSQMKRATQYGAQQVIVIGENEVETGEITIKNLADGSQKPGTLADIISYCKKDL